MDYFGKLYTEFFEIPFGVFQGFNDSLWLSQVTRSVDTERGKLSPQEQRTVDAIVEAR